jgi:hypothetical protein
MFSNSPQNSFHLTNPVTRKVMLKYTEPPASSREAAYSEIRIYNVFLTMRDSECLTTDDSLAPSVWVFTETVILPSTGILNYSYIAEQKFYFIL